MLTVCPQALCEPTTHHFKHTSAMIASARRNFCHSASADLCGYVILIPGGAKLDKLRNETGQPREWIPGGVNSGDLNKHGERVSDPTKIPRNTVNNRYNNLKGPYTH